MKPIANHFNDKKQAGKENLRAEPPPNKPRNRNKQRGFAFLLFPLSLPYSLYHPEF